MTTTYYLRKGKKEATVYIIYRHGEKQVRFPTKVKVDPDQWKGDKDKVDLLNGIKRNKANEDLIETLESEQASKNVSLQKINSKILDIANRLLFEKIDPSCDMVYAEYYKDKSIKTTKSITALKDEFLAYSKTRRAPNTYRQLKSGLKYFLEFAGKQYSGKDFTLDMFTQTFYDNYTAYLYTKDMSDNTVGSKIKVLKTFLHYLKDRRHDINPEFEKYKVIRVKKDVVYLEQKELDTLIAHDFKKPHLDRTRNLFVLQCQTGLRVSDLFRLSKEHIKDDIIIMKAFKNMKPLFIPLTPTAKDIIDKYPEGLPRMLEQVYNRQIKDICREAKLERKIETIEGKASMKVIKKVPLHEKVSSHVATKTFITHCIENGINVNAVSRMTGKTVEVLVKHYLGDSEDQIIVEMNKAFGTPLKIAN